MLGENHFTIARIYSRNNEIGNDFQFHPFPSAAFISRGCKMEPVGKQLKFHKAELASPELEMKSLLKPDKETNQITNFTVQ